MKRKLLSLLGMTLLLTGCGVNRTSVAETSSPETSAEITTSVEETSSVEESSVASSSVSKEEQNQNLYAALRAKVLAVEGYTGNRTVEIVEDTQEDLETLKETYHCVYNKYMKSGNNVIHLEGYSATDLVSQAYCMKPTGYNHYYTGDLTDTMIGVVVDETYSHVSSNFSKAFVPDYATMFTGETWNDYLTLVKVSAELSGSMASMLSDMTTKVSVGDITIEAETKDKITTYTLKQEYTTDFTMTQGETTVTTSQKIESTAIFAFDAQDRVTKAISSGKRTNTTTMGEVNESEVNNSLYTYTYTYPDTYDCFIFPEEMESMDELEYMTYYTPLIYEGSAIGSVTREIGKPAENLEVIFFQAMDNDALEYTLYEDAALTTKIVDDGTKTYTSDKSFYLGIKVKEDFALLVKKYVINVTDLPEAISLLGYSATLPTTFEVVEKDTTVNPTEILPSYTGLTLKDIDGKTANSFTAAGSTKYVFNYQTDVPLAQALMLIMTNLMR